MHEIRLRPAVASDRDRLLEWANDPTTRAVSFHTAAISESSHDAWLAASLAGARALYIVEHDGEAVGVARLDPLGGRAAEVGIAIAPDRRYRGLGTSAVLRLIDTAAASGIAELVARIRDTNGSSLRAFERAGFVADGEDEVNGFRALVYRLRPQLPAGSHDN